MAKGTGEGLTAAPIWHDGWFAILNRPVEVGTGLRDFQSSFTKADTLGACPLLGPDSNPFDL